MHLPTILAAALLPFAAVAEELATTTMTSTMTLTRTVTLARATTTVFPNTTMTTHASTTFSSPTGSATLPATTDGPLPNAGSSLGSAHVAVAAVAGAVVAAFF